jgi:hypothetical protein
MGQPRGGEGERTIVREVGRAANGNPPPKGRRVLSADFADERRLKDKKIDQKNKDNQ